jgi:hypothetical protein
MVGKQVKSQKEEKQCWQDFGRESVCKLNVEQLS